jgi:uroporphyrinogen decarboxylase
MDSRERVLTALAGGRPDRVPCALGFFPQSLFGAEDADEYFGTDVRFVEFAPPPGQDRFLDYLESLPPGVHVGSSSQLRTYHEWGYRSERDQDGAPAGLRDVAERTSRLFSRLTDPRRHQHLRESVQRLHAKGVAVAGSPPHLGGELFESAWRLRGFELFMKDLVKRPELVEYLLDQLTTMAAESARLLAGAGVDVLLLDDDVAYKDGLLISPRMWRRFFKPRLARIVETGRRVAPKLLVFYHSDGDFTALLADLVEIGVNVVNPVAPDCMDAVAIRKVFGSRLALWGTIGTAWTWDFGTPSHIRAEVRSRIDSLGGAGLLLSPAYDLDFAPRENVEAFVQAVHESGQPAAGRPAVSRSRA